MTLQQLPLIPYHTYNVNESFDEKHQLEQQLLLDRLNQLKKRQIAQQQELLNLQKEQLEFECQDNEEILKEYDKEYDKELNINILLEKELNEFLPLQNMSESNYNSISNSLICELSSPVVLSSYNRSIQSITEYYDSEIENNMTEVMQIREMKIPSEISLNDNKNFDKPIFSKFNKFQNYEIFIEKELACGNNIKNNLINHKKIQKKPFLKKRQGLKKYLQKSCSININKTENESMENVDTNNKFSKLKINAMRNVENTVQSKFILENINPNESHIKVDTDNGYNGKSLCSYQDKELEEFELLESALDNTSFSSNLSSISKILVHHKNKIQNSKYFAKSDDIEPSKYTFNDEEPWDSYSNNDESGITKNDDLIMKDSITSKPTDGFAPPVSKLVSKFFPNIEAKNKKQIKINSLMNNDKKIDSNTNRKIVKSSNSFPSDTKNIKDDNHLLILKERVSELESEIKIYKDEIETLLKIKKNFLEEVDQLKNEKLLFEKQKLEEYAKFELYKTDQNKKLIKEKKIFETFHKNAKDQLTRKEREEIDFLKNEIKKLKELNFNKEQKIISSNKRLKDKVLQLEEDNEKLKKDILSSEESRISKQKNQDNKKLKKSNSKIILNLSEPCIQVLKNGPNSPKYNLINNNKFNCSNPLPVLNHANNTEEFNEIIHSDGRIEHLNVDGSREIYYPNGTKKEILSDGISTNITFFNGDIKKIYADHRIMYYYAEAKTRHTTYSNGLEVFEFPNDQVEKHFSNGKKEIIFPDKTIKYIYPDGNEESVLENGTVIRVLLNGDKIMEYPNGQKEIHNKDFKRREYPDGTVKTIYPDGRQETHYPTGRLRIKDRDGVLIVDTCI